VKHGISSPVANYDWVIEETTYGPWGLGVLYNDTDADLPYDTLTVIGVTGTGSGYASIVGGDIYFTPPDGSYSLTYTIQDADGNTSSATVDVEAFHITCGEYECS
jgi:hypothetical protein